MWSMLTTIYSYISIPSFSFSKWVVPSLLFIKYVYYYVVHMLHNFASEIVRHYDSIIFTCHFNPKYTLTETVGKSDLVEITQNQGEVKNCIRLSLYTWWSYLKLCKQIWGWQEVARITQHLNKPISTSEALSSPEKRASVRFYSSWGGEKNRDISRSEISTADSLATGEGSANIC